MKHIYLCGPVSGREHAEAAGHFRLVEEKIRGSGTAFYTGNPLRFCPEGLEWHEAMRICVGEMVRCGGIALLQGWQRSRGAALELKLAQDLRIPVVYVEPPLDFTDLSGLFAAAPETLRYYNGRLAWYYNNGVEAPLAEDRATAELANRYLDPYGFVYIDVSEEG